MKCLLLKKKTTTMASSHIKKAGRLVLKLLGCKFFYFFFRLLLSPLSCMGLFGAPWTAAHQAPLSIGFSGQEYWSGVLFPSPGYLSNPGIKPTSPAAPALLENSLLLSHRGKPSFSPQVPRSIQNLSWLKMAKYYKAF